MKSLPRRHTVNQNPNKITKLKITPSLGSAKGKGNKSSENSVEEGTGFTGMRKIRTKRNYMSLQSDELEDRDIVGARKEIAIKLQSNIVNVAIVVLIITYSFITFIFTSVPEEEAETSVVKAIYHTIESIFLILFLAEVIIYRYAFKEMYFSNKLNFVNFILTLIIIVFWVLDIAINNYTASILFRMRGVMRLFHVPVILENIKTHIKLQRVLSMNDYKLKDDDRPTAEKVIEILIGISECSDDPKLNNDINYCVKHIASGRLYETKQKDTETEEIKFLRKRRGAILQIEEHAWIKSCTNVFKLKRDSNDSGTIIMAAADNRSLESLLDFKTSVTQVMEKLDTLEFNIFDFKDNSKGRELTSLTSLLLHRHSLYAGLHIPINKFLVFMDKISAGYNNVKYHNKTHAADVTQTLYYFVVSGNWIASAKMDNIDICSMILAAAIHDYEHPGYNNMYLINTKDTLAIRYNDISVLESHHVASASSLMKLEKYNIFSKL